MSPQGIVALLVALTSFVTAVTALYHAVTAKRQVAQQQAGLPGGTPAGPPSQQAPPR